MKKFIILLVLALISILPLLPSGFYKSHDGELHLARIAAYSQALKHGQFPVRWLPRLNHGYGYPVANFLYPLPFYLAEPVYFLTGNPAAAVQFPEEQPPRLPQPPQLEGWQLPGAWACMKTNCQSPASTSTQSWLSL